MSAAPTTAKDVALKIIHDQPDDSSMDELIRELAFHRMIERGLADIDAGRTIPHDEMQRRVETWFRSSGR